MTDVTQSPGADDGSTLTAGDREALDRLLVRVARNSDAIEQLLDTVELLADSGAIAGLNGVLEDFDENFNATTRPDFMGMVSNMMMMLGMMTQLRYEPFFNLAMDTPGVLNDAYPRFQEREDKLGLREAFDMMRSPEFAAALELMISVIRAQRNGGSQAARMP